ncbi:MAG: hypothetical protein ACREOC_01265 [Gemmatimonadales bacterium]
MRVHRTAAALTLVNLGFFLATLVQTRPTNAQTTTPLLRARVIELVDERNAIRARLNVESNGEVVFRLLDQRGTIRVKLGAAEDGSGLLLANDATEPGVHILAKAAGSSLKLADKNGRTRILTP